MSTHMAIPDKLSCCVESAGYFRMWPVCFGSKSSNQTRICMSIGDIIIYIPTPIEYSIWNV